MTRDINLIAIPCENDNLIINEESSLHEDSIRLLEKSVLYTHSLYAEESYHSYYHDKIDYFAVARLFGETIGCGAYAWVDYFVVEIKHVFVMENHRGIGAGKKLMEHLENHALKAGANHIRLETTMKQQAAIAMYLSMGYQYCAPYQIQHHGEQVFLMK